MRRPPVVAAAAAGHAAMVRLLLERGADPTVRDTDGRTAADVAKEAAFVDVLGELARVRAVFGEGRAKKEKARVGAQYSRRTGRFASDGHCWLFERGVGGYNAEEGAATVHASTRNLYSYFCVFALPLPAIAAGWRRRIGWSPRTARTADGHRRLCRIGVAQPKGKGKTNKSTAHLPHVKPHHSETTIQIL